MSNNLGYNIKQSVTKLFAIDSDRDILNSVHFGRPKTK